MHRLAHGLVQQLSIQLLTLQLLLSLKTPLLLELLWLRASLWMLARRFCRVAAVHTSPVVVVG